MLWSIPVRFVINTREMTPKFHYFLENFRLFYHFDESASGYGQDSGKKILVRKCKGLSDFIDKKDPPPLSVIWKDWKGTRLPFLFDDDDSKPIIGENDDGVRINYDIVASACFFLTGMDEIRTTENLNNGRYPFPESIIKRLGIEEVPVVNYYFDIFRSALSMTGECKRRDLWKGKAFAAAITHDIDNCNSAWTEGSLSELRKGRFFSIPGLLMNRLAGRDAWFNLDEISATDLRYAESSSFYFLPRKGKSDGVKNADYNINSARVQKTLADLASAGHETGLHGSYGSHSDRSRLKEEISLVAEGKVSGNRFHFLMFDQRVTPAILQECGIKYDTTLGFSEMPGFRRGTCYPFLLYDYENDLISDVVEIPLIVMDATLGFRKYLGLDPGEAFERIKQIIDEIVRFNGVFTLLWHNTFFSRYKFEGWKDVYIKILEYCRRKNGYLTSGLKIYERITGK